MGSVLTVWLIESGFEKNIIGLFALLGIPFSLKILWSPLVDHYAFPLFKKSQRKTWMLFSLVGMASLIFGFSFLNPSTNPGLLAGAILLLSLFKGCLYIVGISYELESLEEHSYALGSAFITTGYRVGLLVAGGGALFLSALWDWSWMFCFMSSTLVFGAILILLLPEPYKSKEIIEKKKQQFSQYKNIFQGYWNEIILQPFSLFCSHPRWKMALFLLISFKAGDEIALSMQNPFYLSLGFNKIDLATVSKVWGMLATLLGGFIGAFLQKRNDSFLQLIKMGFLHAFTLGLFCVLSFAGKSYFWLYVTVFFEHFTGGMAMTAFITFLWKLCDKKYASVQYTLLWSIFSLKADCFHCVGGFLATYCSWNLFFFIVTLMAIVSAWIPYLFAKKEEFIDKIQINHKISLNSQEI